MAPAENPFVGSRHWLGEWTDTSPAWATTIQIVCPVLASVLLSTGGSTSLLVLGGLLLVVGAIVSAAAAWWRNEARSVQLDAAADAQAVMKDALIPLARLVGEIRGLHGPARDTALGMLRSRAASACLLTFEDRERVRAVLYEVADDVRAMNPVYFHGRDQAPQAFVIGTRRGNTALAWLKQPEPMFVPDLKAEKELHPKKWAGSGAGYNTFVSVRLAVGSSAYGMLTVDAPVAGTISPRHVKFVESVAAVLSIAYRDTELIAPQRRDVVSQDVPKIEPESGEAHGNR